MSALAERTGMDTSKLDRSKFTWRGLGLHLGWRRKPVLTLLADKTYPHLYRIQYPDGWLSTPANLSRAKDAAYGHARCLLGWESPHRALYSPEEPALVVTMPPDASEAA